MFKYEYNVFIFAMVACTVAKPAPGVVALLEYSAPLVAAAPGVVTATSSQVIARNYNGISTAPVYAAAPVAKYVTAPVAAPLVAAKYVTSTFSSPLAYSAPLAAAPFGYATSYGYASPLNYVAAPLVL